MAVYGIVVGPVVVDLAVHVHGNPPVGVIDHAHGGVHVHVHDNDHGIGHDHDHEDVNVT